MPRSAVFRVAVLVGSGTGAVAEGLVLFAGIFAVPGAVQEHGGDERGGFLDAGLLLGGQPGRGLEQAAEQEPQFADRDVTAQRPVVDPAPQQRVDHGRDLFLLAAGVSRAELADERGVLAAARGDYAGNAGDAL